MGGAVIAPHVESIVASSGAAQVSVAVVSLRESRPCFNTEHGTISSVTEESGELVGDAVVGFGVDCGVVWAECLHDGSVSINAIASSLSEDFIVLLLLREFSLGGRLCRSWGWFSLLTEPALHYADDRCEDRGDPSHLLNAFLNSATANSIRTRRMLTPAATRPLKPPFSWKA